MIVYNKETYNEDGKFYRTEDWGIEVPDDFSKGNFTEATPKGLDQPVIPKQHFATKAWVLDEAVDQSTIDGLTLLGKLEVYEALEALPEQMKKFNIIMADEKFKMKFLLSEGLNMNHPATIAALDLVDMDIDEIKRKMIELK